MKTFSRSIEIAAPRPWLFTIMQDYARRLEWDAFLSKAELVGGATSSAVGVRALCVDHAGRAMETEYVSFKPFERVAVKMTYGPSMFGAFAGSWIYKELPRGHTEVTFRYSMALRTRLLGAHGDAALAHIFRWNMGKRLASAKERLEALHQASVVK
jgi:ribosome-associated toxin RatA of RatAB toxin-antitoxin module